MKNRMELIAYKLREHEPFSTLDWAYLRMMARSVIRLYVEALTAVGEGISAWLRSARAEINE